MRAHPTSPLPLLLLSLCLSWGCGSGSSGMVPSPGPGTEQDSGTGTDGSTDAGSHPDAGPGADAGSHSDAGTGADAGTPPSADAGVTPDAGSGTGSDAGLDAGSGADAGFAADAGTVADAGVGSCGLPYLGDPSAPLAFTPTAVGPDYTSAPIAEGSTVSVIEPFQGGRVSFIGVRNVLNMDPCGATIIGAIRDKTGTNALQLDSRTFNLKRDADGTGSSDDADTSTFSNVTLCPNNWSSRDLYGESYDLIVILKDTKGKSLQQTLTVNLACNVPGQDAVCKCICKQGYKLGDPCP